MPDETTNTSALEAQRQPEARMSDRLQIQQEVEQTGKFSTNIGQAQDIQIGDRIYHGADAETIKQFFRESLRSLQHEQNTHSVQIGLDALTDLMSAPEIHTAVVTFRTDFEAASDQIAVLGNYKDLHDLLHTLEFQCYGGIVQEARRFPQDEVALDILKDHGLTLQSIVDDIRQIATRPGFVTNETAWVKDLDQAQQELQNAIEALDPHQLQRVLRLINRVLAIQPTRINASLNHAARTLRLPALTKAMTCIRDQLSDAGLDPDKTSQFQTGVEALAKLNFSLTLLVTQHNAWQEIDLELRRIEADLERDISELEMSWLDLKARSELLYSNNSEEWALRFQQDSEALDREISAKNPVKIRRCFRSYRRRAGDRFYRIDVELKRLCGELRLVGEPLASVLRLIK